MSAPSENEPLPDSGSFKSAAFEYWQLGLNIVPVRFVKEKDKTRKKPLVEWTNLQTQKQIMQDFETLPWREAEGFAVIGGGQLNNGLYIGAVDFDVKNTTPEAQERGKKLLRTLLVTQIEQTPSGGQHWVYHSHKKPRMVSAYLESYAVELLGENKLIVMAPSKGYKRLNDNTPTVLADLESAFFEALHIAGLKATASKTSVIPAKRGRRKGKVRYCCEVALQMDRNIVHLMRLAIASEYKKLGWTDDDIVSLFGSQADFDWDTCLTQVRSADPNRAATCGSIRKWGYCYTECPLRESTLPSSVEDENSESSRASQADKMVELTINNGVELFHDDSKSCYARVTHSEAASIHRIRSREFKVWLSKILWENASKAPTSEALNSTINVLESKALFEGKQYRLYNRVAPDPDGDGIWIDMCNDRGQAIHVTAEGWQIVDKPPILFRRYSHQQPLVAPVRGGDPKKFFQFVNLAEDNEDIVIVAVISFLIPNIPHVVLVLYGIQGSAKTTLLKLILALIDPSAADIPSIPRDERELVQQLAHHWCGFYDNVGSLPWWASDVLCRATTGGGFTKRELYTDDDDVIYNFRRCIALNGINIAAQRPDLLDRCLLIGLKHIPEDKRKTEVEFWLEFGKVKGEILGGFLDTLSKAIRIYPTINLEQLYRMADFTRWGCAISEALGINKNKFLAAYDIKVESQIEEAARSSPVAEVIPEFMVGKLNWEGTPSELHSKLLETAKKMGISTRQKEWPKAPNALIRKINELLPALMQQGYEIAQKKSGGTRLITINIVPTVPPHENNGKPRDGTGDDITSGEEPSLIPPPKTDGKNMGRDNRDDRDGISPTSSGAPTTCWICHGLLGGIYEKTPNGPAHPNCWEQLREGLKQQEQP